VQYPLGTRYNDKLLNKSYFIYEGKIVCLLPVRVTAPGSGVYAVDLEIKGLICAEETGTCLPWNSKIKAKIEISDEVRVVSSEKENRPELFSGIDWEAVKWEEATVKRTGVEGGGPGGNGLVTGGVLMPDYQPREVQGGGIHSWVGAIFLALGAGLILNLMPCVLPVIPIKVLSLIQHGGGEAGSSDRFQSLKLGLVFSGGIILVFVILALVMSIFQVLYGQQFQSDAFKLVMLVVIFVLSLSMMGMFEVVLPARMMNVEVVRRGYLGAFGMGVLATVLATPCSAPLLGPVLTWSLSEPTSITVMVFFLIGVGMAAPYLLLTAFPGLIGRIPRGGMWMVRLKQGLGFFMLGFVIYLVFLFPVEWHLPLMIFCVILAFSIWLGMHVVNVSSPAGVRLSLRWAAVVLVICGVIMLGMTRPESQAITTDNWLVTELRGFHDRGQPVVVDFTADWCPNCKFVEKTVLQRASFKDKLKEVGAELVIADWTHRDSAITELLNKLGSKSIPFTAVFPGNDYLQPYVLRDIYSLETILGVLRSLEQDSSG